MNRSARSCPIALASLVLAIVPATGAKADPKAWIEPTELDLGSIEENQIFERFVEIKNVGDGILVVEDLKTSCGCTAAAVDGAVELAAGASQKVRVTFNSKGMDGAIKKTVTISTNDPAQAHHKVTIVADVHRAVRLTPMFLELRDVKSKDAWEGTARLESDAPLALRVQEAYVLGGRLRNAPSKLFDVDVVGPTSAGDRDVHELVVRLRTPAKAQKISEMLVVVTNRPAPEDTLRVQIRGEVVGRIRPSTGFVVMRAVDPGESTQQQVVLGSDGPFHVLSAEVPDSDVKVEVQPGPEENQAVLMLRYVGGEEGVSGVRTLEVKTDDPEQPLVEIPIRFQTRGASPAKAAAHSAAAEKQKDAEGSRKQK